MEVTGRKFSGCDAQRDLDGAQIGARLEQMSGKAVHRWPLDNRGLTPN
jgi:hypothetical protein